jgi:sulfur carrier protein ThiS
MEIKVRLHATLHKAMPSVDSGEVFTYHISSPSSVADLITSLGLGSNEVKAIKVNGRARANVYRLRVNDEVDLFPPIGGG